MIVREAEGVLIISSFKLLLTVDVELATCRTIKNSDLMLSGTMLNMRHDFSLYTCTCAMSGATHL